MPRRAREVLTGGAAAAVVFGAVPAVLVALVGMPAPGRWDRATLLSTRGLFDLLAVVAWVAWAACAWPLLRSVARHVRRREATVPAGARLGERLAVRIAAGVLAVAPLGIAGAGMAGAAPAAAVVVAPAGGHRRAASSGAGAAPTAGDRAALAAVAPDPPAADPAPSLGLAPVTPYTVAVGDSLWSIAERAYGDGADWVAIAAANLGRRMGDGSAFVDPSLIRPGWVLDLPAIDGTPPAAEDPARTGTSPGPPPEDPAAGPPTGKAPATTPAPDVVAPASFRSPDDGGRRAPATSGSAPAHGGVPFPTLAALGFGVVMAGMVARRARQARRLRRLQRPEGVPTPAVSDAAVEIAGAVEPFEILPLLEHLELANRHLAGALETAERTADAPAVQALRAGSDGVEVWLAAPVDWAPTGWELAGPSAWRLSAGDPASLVDGARNQEPWLPIVLPVGDDERGTWLVPVAPGGCLAVLGPDADALVAAMSLGADSWSWRDQVVVTDDPAAVDGSAGPPSHPRRLGPGAPAATGVLFVGDPDELSPDDRALCGVLTTQAGAPADLTLVVDARAVTVHPLGIALRPHLLGPTRSAAVTELLAAPPPADEPPASSRPARHVRPAAEPRRPGGTDLLAGPTEVRLLVAVARIDGLQAALPAKRARRAVELVAYLALHAPDPVTGDRLRTRVLGTEDADAAAKTLFNTAGAARRALGTDGDGRPLLPPASRAGHYRVSPAVTCDVARATELAAAGTAAEDPELALALLREALALVEAEPLSGLLTGYTWWRAEGHEQRVADRLVDAACRLGRSAAAAGHVDLARWAIDQGRLVEPYSEALARVAMEVAAAAGDAGRLRREWLECVRLVDEVDPGSVPSEATERLYVELRRRVPAGARAGGGTWDDAARRPAGLR